MKKHLVLAGAVLFASLAVAQDDAVGVAQKYIKLLLEKNYAEAAKMLQPKSGNNAQSLEMLSRAMLQPQGPMTKLEIGQVIFSDVRGLTGLVIFEKKAFVDPAQAAKLKEKTGGDFPKYFPPDQLAAAKKVIRWEGNAWVTVYPVYLVREIKVITTGEGEGEETRRVPGPWMINMKGENFPYEDYRGEIKKKFGANILRYHFEDQGDMGCGEDINSPRCTYSGENEGEIDPKCYESGSGAPCDSCNAQTGDGDMEPCKVGQKGCLSDAGEPCIVK